MWKNEYYQFLTLCFGLWCAPLAFTKPLKPIISFLRSLGICIIIYLDDMLIISSSKEKALEDFKIVSLMFKNFGFVLNMEKSIALSHSPIIEVFNDFTI